MTDKTINHFMFLRFSGAFWALPAEQRAASLLAFAQSLQGVTGCTNFYQVSPLKAGVDLLVWNAAPLESETDEAAFFQRLARGAFAHGSLFEQVEDLWGYTRPSVYSRAPSPQEIDPFAARRQPYLVLYPFVKTIQWYLLGKDTRQGMMNEHIRIGHQYPEIKQLLLYSFGVQDQEFIVVYETENLYHFSELVNELRGSDVREYTQRDTPVYTALWRSPGELAELVGAKG